MLGGKKGNVRLMSFDGQYQVEFVHDDLIAFDERIQVAKELIDSCLDRWTEDSRPELRTVVRQAFQSNKDGQLRTAEIFKLRRWDIQEPEWLQAMDALADACFVTGKRSYIRVRRRNPETEKFDLIPMSLAAV